MPILQTSLRNDLADQFDNSVNTGAGTSQGKFETVANAAVATVNFQNPAFGSASSGAIVLQGVPLLDTNAVGGTITKFSIYNRNGAKLCEFTVGTSGSEVNITSVVIAATETVQLTSLTITMPAS